MGGSSVVGLGFSGNRGLVGGKSRGASTRNPPAWKSKVMETFDHPSRLSNGVVVDVKSFNMSLHDGQNHVCKH